MRVTDRLSWQDARSCAQWVEETGPGDWSGRLVAASLQQQDAHYVSESGRKVGGVLTKCSHGSRQIFLQDELRHLRHRISTSQRYKRLMMTGSDL